MDNGKITITDVANELGVSKSTVSRAISGKGRVGDETRNRILKYIEVHNYVPSALAKGLAKKRTYNIGLSLPEEFGIRDLPFFKKCMSGILTYAGKNDYDVIVTLTSNSDVSQLERMIDNRKVDGVILSRTFTEDKAVELLKEKNVPFVTLGSSDDKNVIQVDNDHHMACKMLTESLIKQGYEKIALLCGDTSYVVTNNRMSGYLDAMQEAGIFNANSMVFANADDTFFDLYIERIIYEKYDCILCMDDSICVRVIDKLKSRGLEIPRDIKVASFYNSSTLERNVPTITTLKFDAGKLGREACRILLDMIDEKEVPQRTLLDFEISMKESTSK